MKFLPLFRIFGPTVISLVVCNGTAIAQQTSTSANGSASATANSSVQGNGTQQQGNAAGEVGVGATANGVGSSMRGDGSADGSATASMLQVPAELVTKLDSKTAKAGDAVEAKTTKTVRTADGMVIQKGSKLLGTVKQAQAHTKGQSEGLLALNFDRVQLKSGQQMLLRSTIDSVSALEVSTAAGADDMVSAGPISSGGTGPARGGLGGGLVGGAAAPAGGALGSTTRELGNTVQSAGGQAMGRAQGLTNDVNGSVSGAAQQSGALSARATNLPGVLLSSSAAGSGSGVLSSTDRNVHLDSGTRMVLSVAAQR